MNDLSSNLQQGLWWTQTSSSPHGGGGATPWGAPHWLSDTKEEIQHATSQEMEQEHDQQGEEEMEHMFEKPLTPSDVGKLNRLVIPKQHAEKYFPLSRADSVEKGLLLSFEDESGKLWRFRYSYWNSSQSYVLTKGWSRFVKEKQLDAGDVVSFERRRPDGQQLYIRWRRRVAPPAQDCRPVSQNNNTATTTTTTTTTTTSSPSSSSAWTRVYYSAHPYPSHHLRGPLLYQPDCIHAAAQPVVQNPVATGNKKRVRLFGVNLDCQLDEPEPEPEPPSPDTSSFSSQGGTHFIYSQGHHIQQGYNFSGEYNQTRNYPGGSGDMSI